MLRGASTLHLDTKGRLAIPSRYREDLTDRCDGRMVVTVNALKRRCLWMYPMDEWKQVEPKVAALPDFDLNHQSLKRFFLGYASDVEMDKNGRILLPAPLREYAMLNKEICLAGLSNKFELWDAAEWRANGDQWTNEAPDMEKMSPELEQLAL